MVCFRQTTASEDAVKSSWPDLRFYFSGGVQAVLMSWVVLCYCNWWNSEKSAETPVGYYPKYTHTHRERENNPAKGFHVTTERKSKSRAHILLFYYYCKMPFISSFTLSTINWRNEIHSTDMTVERSKVGECWAGCVMQDSCPKNPRRGPPQILITSSLGKDTHAHT